MNAEQATGLFLIAVALVLLLVALRLLGIALREARAAGPAPKPQPRRLWADDATAVYVDMRGVQPYVLREALYRAGVGVYGVQPPRDTK